MQQYLQNKEGLVENVFNKVYDKYDLMNDCMSFGAHRMWKKNLISWMNPSSNKILVDVACGTGDIGKLFLDITNKDNEVICVDKDYEKISKLKRGIIPIYEPGLSELVKQNYKAKRLSFTTSLAEGVQKSNIIFLCVGTPTKKNTNDYQ